MSKTKPTKLTKEEKFIKVWNDPYLFAKNYIKIVNKSGNLVKFDFNPPQKEFVENMGTYNVILKSRQMGFSVCVCALALHRAITQPFSNCLMLSHNQESTNAIFNKLKQMYATIPSAIKPKLLRNNRAELMLSNGSIISCSVLGKKDKGRGNTLSLIHISEFAFVGEQAETQLLGLEQALNATGNLIIESTANGINFFNSIYYKAKAKESAYSAHFYNYVDGSVMFQDEYVEYQKIFRNINGHEFGEDDLTDEEKELFKQEGMTLDILCWRRLKIQNSNIDTFNQEFPLSDDLAFQVSGDSVIDKKIIHKNKARLKEDKVKPIPRQNLVNLDASLQAYYGNSYNIYEQPVAGRKYVIGADISQGIGKDYHVFIVMDTETKKEVAIFRNNKIRPDQCADVLNTIGRNYNKALISVELASGGHSTIDRLYHHYKYYNMYRHKTYDEYGKVRTKIGFDTNSKTKGIVINTLREMFEKGVIQINSEIVLDEMLMYQANNGKYGASGNHNDDTVMALAILCETMKKLIWYAM